jgi:hypothetical protein
MFKTISTTQFAKKILALLGVLGLVAGHMTLAYAGTLTNFSDTLSTVKISQLSTHTLRFTTPTAIATNAYTIVLTFPTDFNFTAKTIATVSFTHGASTGLESTETLAASPSATAWGAVFSSTQNRVLTLTAPTDGVGSASVAANDKIIITYDSTNSTNGSSAASYTVTAVANTAGTDGGTTTLNLISNDTVAVTATVAQSISFALLSATGTSFASAALYYGTLGSGAAKYASSTNTSGDTAASVGHQLTVATNAPGGYTVSIQGDTLRNNASSTSSITAIGGSPATSSAGSSQFGINVTTSGGTGATIGTPYATGSQFGFSASTSTAATLASGSQPTNTTTYSLTYLANIPATQAAGNYSTSLTYVGTANF